MTDQSKVKLGSSTDPYNHATERGWDITDASQLTSSLELEADVVSGHREFRGHQAPRDHHCAAPQPVPAAAESLLHPAGAH